jgi:hypothetical protein
MAAKRENLSFFASISAPVLLAMCLSIVAVATADYVPSNAVLDIMVLVLRIVLAAAAGYLAVRRASFGLWGAAAAGAVVFLAEHVVVVGVYFLATAQWSAALGVVISYLLFFWVAGIIGLVGGIAARIRGTSERAAI